MFYVDYSINKEMTNYMHHEPMSIADFPNATTEVYYFWKGTPFPLLHEAQPSRQVNENFKAMQRLANEMIKGMLKDGVSLEEIKTTFKDQMDDFEACLEKHSDTGQRGGMMGPKMHKKVEKEIGKPFEAIWSFWVLNVLALLKLKVIENDDMNGVLFKTTIGGDTIPFPPRVPFKPKPPRKKKSTCTRRSAK